MNTDTALTGLRRLAASHGSDVAYTEDGGDSITYAQLNRAVAVASESYRSLTGAIGLLAPDGIEWLVAYLALMQAGKTIVPLPGFFSDAQITHIIKDAGIGHILAASDTIEKAGALGVTASKIFVSYQGGTHNTPVATDNEKEMRLVVYTSGSTGQPKGVCIGIRQLAHIAKALGQAIGARRDDFYLSVLPLSLLLEQVCAIHISLQTGVPVVFGSAAPGDGIAGLVNRIRPTLMVLVPQLLAGWVAALEASGTAAPETLRLVAAGGATVPQTLADLAWKRGIPVHEGYGLSECCSVVSLNRPGARAAGTVGHPIDGVKVTLEDGEIVVEGPTVMEGYLNRQSGGNNGIWRTGDLGEFDSDGRLIVFGRKDSMLVTPTGRNVVPEWIEALVTADPRLVCAVLERSTTGDLLAILVPHPAYQTSFEEMSPAALETHIATLVASAPGYARPERCVVASLADMQRRDMVSASGQPRRQAIREAVGSLLEDTQIPLSQ